MSGSAEDPASVLEATHTPAAIRNRLASSGGPSYLRDFLFGAVDGTVTTFAVVSGVAGAGLSSVVIVILGTANLLADGFSMAAGNFLGARADGQLRDKLRRMEEQHIAEYPEGEQEEIRQIFLQKGFAGEDLERAVRTITANRERWVETMLIEEHGLASKGPEPWRAAAATFVAFVVVGGVPLAPYLSGGLGWPVDAPFVWSSVLTAVAFFFTGAAKSSFVGQRWWVSGLETLALGGAAAAVAYVVGMLLGGMAR